MTWRLAAFVLLALVLAGGFAWFERSRPPARVVALVAALAALAVAGRLVFAPIPNVQATTDIVLFTGFALGAAPGFAVGALAALVSNLWLGQGPWTPWEMAGWGLVGVGGAWLGAVTGRRLGRFGLAAACGLAGLAYGALLDISVLVTAGGSFSLDRYLAISARSLPFNVAHALGNVALALAAGPALVRMISRYRSRLEFTWRPELAAPLLLVLALVPAAQGERAWGAAGAPGWLIAAKNSDGGFGVGPGEQSSAAMTGWAMLGLEAAGINPRDVGARTTPVEYLRAHTDQITSTGDLERTILALSAAGVDPRHFTGDDLVARLRLRRSADGSFQGQVDLTAFGVLGLKAGGLSRSRLVRSARWLRSAQGDDGGWGFQPGAPSDPDSTGAALQAIGAISPRAPDLHQGIRWLERDQNPDGGWPVGGSGSSNSQSTAWAIQGLIAAGEPPKFVSSHGRSGREFLAARQADDGHYRYSATSDQTPVWVTGQALAAASGEAFPLAAVPRAPKPPPSSGGGGGDSGQGGSGDSGGGTTSSTTSTTFPTGGGTGYPYTPSGPYGGASRYGAGGGNRDHGNSGGSGRSGAEATGVTAASRRLFAQATVPKADVPAPPRQVATGDDAPLGKDLLIGCGILALVALGFGGWGLYRRGWF